MTTTPITTVSGRTVGIAPRPGGFRQGAVITAGTKTVLTLPSSSLKALHAALDAALFGTFGVDPEARIRSLAAHNDLEVTITPVSPRWQPGDVVVLRFRPHAAEYTYVRGAHSWPGQSRILSDEQVTSLWRQGLVRHVLRNGQPV